jgi:hypothetical protein
VGAGAVIELDEIGAPAIDPAKRREDPGVSEDRFLEGPEDAFDASIRPWVRGTGARVSNVVFGEKRLEDFGTQVRSVVPTRNK